MGLELGLLWCSMQLDSHLVIRDLPPRLTFPMQGGHYAVTESFKLVTFFTFPILTFIFSVSVPNAGVPVPVLY